MRHIHERYIFGADMMMQDFLREEDLCATIKKEIIPLMKHNDFTEMYSDGGRPPASPKVLMIVTVLQYLEGLSDRAAAFNLRYRIDWKIALGLEIDDLGIHHTTLSRFRDRVLEFDKASYAFDKILEHLVKLKLVKADSKQRIDSTHVIAKVRELSRLELLQETLRKFVLESKDFEPKLGLVSEIYKTYKNQMSDYKISKEDKTVLITKAGVAMRALITWIEASKNLIELEKFKSFGVLKTVFNQNFEDSPNDDDPKLIPIATGKDHICSPHESEARFANKGGNTWIGYKAQIAETVSEEKNSGENFITFAEISGSNDRDGNVMTDFINEQDEMGVKPSKIYGDTHYNSESNIIDAKNLGVELRGPVLPKPEKDPTKEENRGFQTDLENKVVTCPAGHESARYSERSQNRISVTFDQWDCEDCELQEICNPAPRGKSILINKGSSELEKRRLEMKTEEYRKEMNQRNGIEGTLSGLIRGQGLRQSRYRGKNKARLGIKFAAASANIKRLHQYYVNERSA